MVDTQAQIKSKNDVAKNTVPDDVPVARVNRSKAPRQVYASSRESCFNYLTALEQLAINKTPTQSCRPRTHSLVTDYGP
jgi:hypothetical protein